MNAHQVSVKSVGAKGALCLPRFQPSLDERNQNRWRNRTGMNRYLSTQKLGKLWLFCPALVTCTEIKGDTN